MALRLYTSVPKGLTLKVRKFWRLGSTFVEVTGKSLSRVIFGSFSPSSWIGLNNTPVVFSNAVSNQVKTNEQVSRTWFKKLEKEKLIFTKVSINAAIEKNDFSVPKKPKTQLMRFLLKALQLIDQYCIIGINQKTRSSLNNKFSQTF